MDLVVADRAALRGCWQWPGLKAADLSQSHPETRRKAEQTSRISKSSVQSLLQLFLQRHNQQQYGRQRRTPLPMGRVGLALHQSAAEVQSGKHRVPLTDSWPSLAALFGSTSWSTTGGDYLMVRGPVGACGSGFEFRRTVNAPCKTGEYDGGNLIGTDDVLVGDEVVSIGHVSAIGLCPATAESLVEKFLLHPVERTFSDANTAEHGGTGGLDTAGAKKTGPASPAHAFRVLLRRRQPRWNEWWQQVGVGITIHFCGSRHNG